MHYRTYLCAVNNMEGPHYNFPQLISFMPFETLQDYKNYFSRLKAFPIQINQTIQLLQQGVEEGRVFPRCSLSNIEKQLKGIIETPVEESPFFKPLKQLPSQLKPHEVDLLEVSKELISGMVYPAYKTLLDYFVSSYYPMAKDVIGVVQYYPDGAKFYETLLKFHTGTNLTAQEIFKIGNEEVNRIKKRMEEIVEKVGFKGSLADFISYLRSDKQFYFSTESELLNAYRVLCKRIDPKLGKLIGKLPRAQYGIKKVPQHNAPSCPAAYYMGPSATGDRPGIFYVNTFKLDTRPKYEMIALACHEAVPGHHLQISLTTELSGFPEWRTNIEDSHYYLAPGRESMFTGYIEGWGLYAESLAEDLNLFKGDDYGLFGRLSLEIWRACRLVVDTGIHAFGWTQEEAVQFMFKNTALSLHNIQTEVARYITWPGQACAYKIGELKIKELRSLATNELGDKWKIKEFHDLILAMGPCSLTLLETKTKQWIQSKINSSK
eukprot:TRINITY_DN2363_c0_g1_i1.p1 TRINITY_DN2363_c0_g1~~TRINITY_DN2363_c0_g1_i1.p1  ORF type:complete len:492 (+),score=116.25 TRINITY_DN2363_c0_g1_i1:323-1798(+)